MDNKLEIIHNLLPLLETIEEGLEHISLQLSELRYEEAFVLLQDSFLGISSIENSLDILKSDFKRLQSKKEEQMKKKLKKTVAEAVALYEDNRPEELQSRIEKVTTDFRVWKKYLEEVLKPKIII